MILRRGAVVCAALVGLPLLAGPAAAAARPTHVTVVTTPSTVIGGGTVVVSGAATPARAGSTVVLQRANGTKWTTLAHQKSGAAGTFAFHLKAPKAAATWLLRVIRSAGTSLVAGSYPVTVTLTDAGGQTASLGTVSVVQQTTLLGFGFNYSGEVGDGSTTDRHTPVPVEQRNAVTSVSGNGNSVLALRADGSVIGLSSVVAVASGQTQGYALTADGTVWAAGAKAVAIAASVGTGYAVLADGTVWAWGSNGSGQLGTAASAGSAHARCRWSDC